MRKWLPVIFWCFLIFLGSSIPSVQVSGKPLVNIIVHKSAHLFEYAVLGILVFRATKSYWWAFVFCTFYGLTDEAHQLLVPGRSGRLRDVFVDIIGCSLGLFIVWKYLPRLPKKLRNWLLI